MARKTKQEAQATKARLLDAAEDLFYTQGVAGTSLAQIAEKAGTTRGAIYWHFKDKADLFNAMMDRLTLPFEEELASMLQNQSPLQALSDHAVATMKRIQQEQHIQQALSIAMLMVELVPEHLQIRERHEFASKRHIERIKNAVCQEYLSKQRTPVAESIAEQIAIGMHSMIFGLMHLWLINQNFDLAQVGRMSLDAFLAGWKLELASQNRS